MMTNKCFPLLSSKMMSLLIYKLLGNDFEIPHMFEGKYTPNQSQNFETDKAIILYVIITYI